jgi:hypothetical protein
VALEGETVLCDFGSGRLSQLDPVATAVWERCTGAASLHEIHHAVSAQLDLPLDHVHEHMVSCIVQWSHDGLVAQPDKAGR